MVNRIRQHLLKFPPDLSFGFQPNTPHGYRSTYAILSSLKNILPLFILDVFRNKVWSQDYDRISETLPQMLKMLPYLPILLLVFPLTAGVNRIDRTWEEYCSDDIRNFKRMFTKKLPFDEVSYDKHNNKQDIFNKLLFYPSYMVLALSFTVVGIGKLLPTVFGTFGFLIHGYHSGYWADINARIRAKTVVERTSMNNIGYSD